MHGRIDSILHVEWRPLAKLGELTAPWRRLAEGALEPNVFYEPSFAMPAASVFGNDASAALVWSHGPHPRLLGFFPACMERRRYGIDMPVLVGWTHPYAPLGAPLVDREKCNSVIAAWLDDIARHSQLPKLMLLPYLPDEGPLAGAIEDALAARAPTARALPVTRVLCWLRTMSGRAISQAQSSARSARSCAVSASGWASAAS